MWNQIKGETVQIQVPLIENHLLLANVRVKTAEVLYSQILSDGCIGRWTGTVLPIKLLSDLMKSTVCNFCYYNVPQTYEICSGL